MTRDEIIKMAREAWGSDHEIFWFDDCGIERFAALVAAAEREACAELLDENAKLCVKNKMLREILEANADAIRARGAA